MSANRPLMIGLIIVIVPIVLIATGDIPNPLAEYGISFGASAPANPYPEDQVRFNRLIADYQVRFKNAANDIVKARIPKERDAAVCQLLGDGRIANWRVKLGTIENSWSGHVVLTAFAGSGTMLRTNSIESLDSEQTIVPKGTPLALKIEKLRTGAYARVTGNFFREANGCFREHSLTDSGGISEPSYTFRFIDVAAE